MASYNAWSEVRVGGEDGKTTKIMPGDPISAGDVGLEEEDFQNEYVDTGIAREVEYPVPDGVTDQSPTDYFKQQLAALANPEVDQEAIQDAIRVAAGLPETVDEASAQTQTEAAPAATQQKAEAEAAKK